MCNSCGSENAIVHYVCFTELHVTLNSTEILIVAQQCFNGKFMSQVEIKRT